MEALLLFSAAIVALMGLMYEAIDVQANTPAAGYYANAVSVMCVVVVCPRTTTKTVRATSAPRVLASSVTLVYSHFYTPFACQRSHTYSTARTLRLCFCVHTLFSTPCGIALTLPSTVQASSVTIVVLFVLGASILYLVAALLIEVLPACLPTGSESKTSGRRAHMKKTLFGASPAGAPKWRSGGGAGAGAEDTHVLTNADFGDTDGGLGSPMVIPMGAFTGAFSAKHSFGPASLGGNGPPAGDILMTAAAPPYRVAPVHSSSSASSAAPKAAFRRMSSGDASFTSTADARGDTCVNPMFLLSQKDVHRSQQDKLLQGAASNRLGSILTSPTPPDEDEWAAVVSSYSLMQRQVGLLMASRAADKKVINTVDITGDGTVDLGAPASPPHLSSGVSSGTGTRARSISGTSVRRPIASSPGRHGAATPPRSTSTALGGIAAATASSTGGVHSAPGGTTRCPTPLRRMEYMPRFATSGGTTPAGCETPVSGYCSPSSTAGGGVGGQGRHRADSGGFATSLRLKLKDVHALQQSVHNGTSIGSSSGRAVAVLRSATTVTAPTARAVDLSPRGVGADDSDAEYSESMLHMDTSRSAASGGTSTPLMNPLMRTPNRTPPPASHGGTSSGGGSAVPHLALDGSGSTNSHRHIAALAATGFAHATGAHLHGSSSSGSGVAPGSGGRPPRPPSTITTAAAAGTNTISNSSNAGGGVSAPSSARAPTTYSSSSSSGSGGGAANDGGVGPVTVTSSPRFLVSSGIPRIPSGGGRVGDSSSDTTGTAPPATPPVVADATDASFSPRDHDGPMLMTGALADLVSVGAAQQREGEATSGSSSARATRGEPVLDETARDGIEGEWRY